VAAVVEPQAPAAIHRLAILRAEPKWLRLVDRVAALAQAVALKWLHHVDPVAAQLQAVALKSPLLVDRDAAQLQAVAQKWLLAAVLADPCSRASKLSFVV